MQCFLFRCNSIRYRIKHRDFDVFLMWAVCPANPSTSDGWRVRGGKAKGEKHVRFKTVSKSCSKADRQPQTVYSCTTRKCTSHALYTQTLCTSSVDNTAILPIAQLCVWAKSPTCSLNPGWRARHCRPPDIALIVLPYSGRQGPLFPELTPLYLVYPHVFLKTHTTLSCKVTPHFFPKT
jgi:hypothetical protein